MARQIILKHDKCFFAIVVKATLSLLSVKCVRFDFVHIISGNTELCHGKKKFWRKQK